MMVVVPDASIILKWLLPGPEEADTNKALQIRDAFVQDECRLYVPSLWYYEVGNTLARKFPEFAAPLLKSVMNLNMEECGIQQNLLESTLDLVRRFNVTFYDASYHAIALQHEGVFVTADRKYFSKTEAVGSVCLLQNWAPHN